jgi:hypothetical protein
VAINLGLFIVEVSRRLTAATTPMDSAEAGFVFKKFVLEEEGSPAVRQGRIGSN